MKQWRENLVLSSQEAKVHFPNGETGPQLHPLAYFLAQCTYPPTFIEKCGTQLHATLHWAFPPWAHTGPGCPLRSSTASQPVQPCDSVLPPRHIHVPLPEYVYIVHIFRIQFVCLFLFCSFVFYAFIFRCSSQGKLSIVGPSTKGGYHMWGSFTWKHTPRQHKSTLNTTSQWRPQEPKWLQNLSSIINARIFQDSMIANGTNEKIVACFARLCYQTPKFYGVFGSSNIGFSTLSMYLVCQVVILSSQGYLLIIVSLHLHLTLTDFTILADNMGLLGFPL